MRPFLVVSQWNNDVSWIKELSDDYIIYDKSNTLEPDEHVLKVDNVGHNLFDIFHFCYNNYDNLPEMIAFVEGNPFDHCNREKLERLLKNRFFTPLESYENVAEGDWSIKCSDSGWMEINNSWYIHNHPRSSESIFRSYNEALDYCFLDPIHPKWIRFAPGGQYLVEKERILFYTREWWKKMMDVVSKHNNQPEAYVFERMLWTIFSCSFKERL